MSKLIVQYADGRTNDYELNKPEVFIGRDAACDLPLDDTIISGRHARPYCDSAAQPWIPDLRRRTATVLNQTALSSPRELHYARATPPYPSGSSCATCGGMRRKSFASAGPSLTVP